MIRQIEVIEVIAICGDEIVLALILIETWKEI